MSRRSKARQVAFQVLYQDDLNPRSNPAASDELIEKRLHSAELAEFSRGLVSGVRSHCPEMDKLIEQVAENWSLKRMTATDRNVLRLGAFEILHTDTPDRVAIDEAVELAKRFGTAQSAQFVNGILDKLMHMHDKDEGGRMKDENSGQ
ncbi:MAG: transcription antitermination factor NusB [Thermoguttaceae bacterium]|jgi:N utilization substance protein B